MGQEQSSQPSPPPRPPSRAQHQVGKQGQGQKTPAPGHAVQAKPGLMERIRATVGHRRLEDVCTIDQNSKALGKGTFGTVYKGRLKTGHGAAVKIIEKGKLKQMKVSSSIVASECEMMRECAGRQNFVQLYDIVETENRFCLILELCDGGNVQDGAMGAEGTLGEKQVRFLVQQMLESIYFLHSKNICHRDIKPHNYLLVGDIRSPAVKLKLGDFGTALRLERGKLLKDQVGTPAFMAPEIHLLPNKSSGYDHKVDVWAVGVCMIFLLANEYPFIDGQGRLLRHRIIQGDVPLWEANAFQNLFQGAQEVLGLVKRRPSKTARDLTRQLLAPRRQDRLSAWAALKHDWFTRPLPESTGLEDVTDNLPLLDMKDFEDAFSRMERDVGEKVGWALDELSKVQLGTVEEVRHIDPTDDRIQSCVVCYGVAGDFGYVCPQCYHTVCLQCLQQLPKAVCPHCRHEAADMAITHTIAQLAKTGSQQSNKLLETANSALASLPLFEGIDVPTPSRPLTAEDGMRRRQCHCCSKPASSTNYVCPTCCATLCFECTKNILVHRPQCPSCGECERVAHTVPQYIAANEAWASAAQFGDAISQTFSDVTRRFSSFSSSTQTGPSTPVSGCGASDRCSSLQMASPSRGERSRGHYQEERSRACCLCRHEVSMFDHVCPCCNASVCSNCVCNRLPIEDLRCPSCNDAASNAHNLRVIATANKAKGTWSNFWGSVFFGEPNDRNAQTASFPVSFLSPVSACQQSVVDEQHSVNLRRGTWP